MHVELAAETIARIGPFPITNSLLVTVFTTIFLSTIAYITSRKVSQVPSGLQNFFELIIEAVYGMIEDLAHHKAKAFFPLVMTFFLFIITSNWFGLLPGFGTIGFYESRESSSHAKEEQQIEKVQTKTENDEHATSIEKAAVSEKKTEESSHKAEEKVLQS